MNRLRLVSAASFLCNNYECFCLNSAMDVKYFDYERLYDVIVVFRNWKLAPG